MNRRTALLAASVVALLASSCAPGQTTRTGEEGSRAPQVAKTLVVITAGELPTFAEKKILPVGLTTSIRAGGEETLNARLALLDARGLPQPFLAETLPDLSSGTWQVLADGKMETTYQLHSNLTWHDGQPLTSEDFVFAWRVYATKELGVSTNGGFRYVEEVAAPDPRSVVIRWKQPYPDAVAEVLVLPPLPRHILEQPLQTLQAEPFMSLPFWREEYVGAGPWRLDRREPGAFFEVTAFDGFVFGRPRIDRVRVIYIPDPNTSVATLLAGEAHFAIYGILYGEDGLILEQRWGSTGGTVLWEAISPRVMEVQSRPEFAIPPQLATDVRVRRAVAFAMDREAMMGAVTAGKGLLRDVYTHPDADDYATIIRAVPITYRYDPRRAEQLLQEAGFSVGADGIWASSSGDRFALEQWYIPSSNNERESQILVDGLRQFGIDASSHVFGVQRTSVEERVKTPGLFGGTKADPLYNSRDIAPTENRWTGANRFGFSNPEMDRFLDAYDVTLDRSERTRLRAQMERIAMEELPAIPLYWNPRVIPYIAGLKGVGRRLVENSGTERTMWQWEWQHSKPQSESWRIRATRRLRELTKKATDAFLSSHRMPPWDFPGVPVPRDRRQNDSEWKRSEAMASSSTMPRQAAIAVDDMLDNCAQIQPGQNVLIVAAPDGLFGGTNLVDEQTVSWIQAAVQQRGAFASVLWVDMPIRPSLIWDSGHVEGWRVPPVLKGALSGADVFINLCVDLSIEEEGKEIGQILRELNVPMVRNMATTASLLTSTWAQTPYELVSEIRFQTASLLEPGKRWVLTHPNGTHLEGTVGTTASASQYASRRTEGVYRPFPEGVFPALTTIDAEGDLAFEGTNPIWARHIGIPSHFETPVRLTIREGHIREFNGGREADQLRQGYAALAEELGDDAYHIRGTHGGVHPYAQVTRAQCPDDDYRNFVEHHHWSRQHVHLGNSQRKKDFPYNMHVTAEVRGATLKVGEKYVWQDGRLSALDHPAVAAVAARYPGRPGLRAELWQ